jgi:opacity protein-like surface antigen
MTRGKSLFLGLGFAFATLFGSMSVAEAQYAPYYPPPPPPPPRGVYRSGLIFGGSVGWANFSFSQCGDGCGTALSGEFHIGGMVGPRLALEGDFWGSNHWFSDSQASGVTFNGIYTLALQYWPTDIIWVKAGLGVGHLTYDDDSGGTDDETGFAFMLAAGVEVIQSYNFALDLQIRYGNATYNSSNVDGGPGVGDTNMVAFLVGVNWY